jgi:hypothetical protein
MKGYTPPPPTLKIHKGNTVPVMTAIGNWNMYMRRVAGRVYIFQIPASSPDAFIRIIQDTQ